MANAVHGAETASPERLGEIVERGVQVMPFALDKTQHIFNKTENGGIQQVIAKDHADSEQIALIRKHLLNLAQHFATGDFSGPQRIHGEAMPGVKALSMGASKLHFDYSELANGAQIRFRTKEPDLIAAVHQYFDAQLSDHGHHAMSDGHMMHHGQ
jgi:hypothetical protein